jgi:hypothetical protein
MKIRKTLGRIKWYLFGVLPYYPLKKKGEASRLKWMDRASELPSLRWSGQSGPEIHMMCGTNHVNMGIWASWSLLRFLPGASLILHSDGSLRDEHLESWRRVIPNLTLITKEESDLRARQVLKDKFPLLSEWRARQFYSVKFIDFHLHGTSDRIVVLDSDVLCFDKPKELIEGLNALESPLLWHIDDKSYYLAPTKVLKACTNVEVIERVNTGFLLTKRWQIADLQYFENILQKLQDHSLPIFHYWAEQTMYSISANRHGYATAFSDKYSVYFGKTLQKSTIRHFAGVPNLRPRFYTEGVPTLFSQINQTRKLLMPD